MPRTALNHTDKRPHCATELENDVRSGKQGPPKDHPETVVADKAYSYPSPRQVMRQRRVGCINPVVKIPGHAASGLIPVILTHHKTAHELRL